MHAIRSYARRAAWYNDEVESTHNPFKKIKLQRERRRQYLATTFPTGPVDLECPVDLESSQSSNTPQTSNSIEIPLKQQIRTIITSSWANLLVFTIPVGFVLYYTHVGAIAIFIVNFVAIIPSSSILGLATDELALHFDKKVLLVGLISSTFGNAVQLIQSILLLKSRQIAVLRVSLLGSILSNLLLSTGLSFFVGGLTCWDGEQFFDKNMTQTITMLLFLAVTSLVIPTASHYVSGTEPQDIIRQSRGIAIVIVVSYLLYLIFQFETHRYMFDGSPQIPHSTNQPPTRKEGDTLKDIISLGVMPAMIFSDSGVRGELRNTVSEEPGEKDEIKAQLTPLVAIVTIILSTALVAFNTQFATDTIQSLIDRSVSPTFIGLVILPILSLDMGAVKFATRDKMDYSISLTLGRCLQLALLVVPLTILIAWWIHVDDMSLQFDPFTIVSLFITMVVLGYVVQEGKSNWLTGALLIKIYIIVAIASWWTKS